MIYSKKVCINCGSSEFVSDRSLGGRIVCLQCGSTSFRSKSLSQLGSKKIIYLVIGLIVLFLIII